jgi:DNA modification methylase
VKPYYEDKWVKIFNGDCRDVLPTLDIKVDLVLTDPPYGIDNDGKTNFQMVNGDFGFKDVAYRFGTYQAEDLVLVKSSMRENAAVVMFYDNKEVTTIWRQLESAGFNPKQIIYWFKGYKGINPRHNFNSTIESAIFAVRDSKYTWNGGGNTSNMFVEEWHELNNPVNNFHPTQKPITLMSWIIQLLTNATDSILDPFLGSGTTCYCAKKLNRYSIGIEIEEKYCEIAAKRCMQESFEFDLPTQSIEKQEELSL